MVQEIQIQAWCDSHFGERGERVPAQTFTMGGQELELCEECFKAFLLPAQELLRAYGRSPEGPAVRPVAPVKRKALRGPAMKKRGERATEDPDRTVQAVIESLNAEALELRDRECVLCGFESITASATNAHCKARHGTSTAIIYGNQCPICGEEFIRGIGAHTVRTHAGLGAAATFEVARQLGDPFGVVKVRERDWRSL